MALRNLMDRWWVGWAAAVAMVVGSYAWLWLQPDPVEPPRYRQYRPEAVCLLTGEAGVLDSQVAPIWAGMQEASLRLRVRVSHVAISGPQTVDNGATFVAGMAQGRCDLLLAAGEVATRSVALMAPRFPEQRFAVVGGSKSDNVTVVEGTASAARDLMLEGFSS
ncbi:hypothetical protein [Catellatospora sp. NPDC049609]|uniref:hypothetical protein n=1 Tax=Catellatospora sp. NPDC049609 TaxID=3155505 RepID=UPI00341B1312